MNLRAPVKLSTVLLASVLFFPIVAHAQSLSFRETEAKIREYGSWLDAVGGNGARFWVRLDSTRRPHRLYVGDAFQRAAFEEKENFIEIFSSFLAGHPEKNMLIDIFDHSTGKLIGEYGFGGFRLFQ